MLFIQSKIIIEYNCVSKCDGVVLFAQLGARKSALGATKVTANFEDLERKAVLAEKLKMEVRLTTAS